MGNTSNSGPGGTHHRSPRGNPSGTARPADVDAMDAQYMSGEGHWARPDRPPPGTTSRPAGFADCPMGALDEGSGFGAAQAIVDTAGDNYGCHGCGARESGWPRNADGSQHWTCDHQPPRTTYSASTASRTGDSSSRTAAATPSTRTAGASATVRLYPHCMNCSRRQGGIVNGMVHSDRVDRGVGVMAGH